MTTTPRCVMVLMAAASASVPISSTMTTCGVWFCTVRTRSAACASREGTITRRLSPMQACGTASSPAISFDVSTTMVERPRTEEQTRAMSLQTSG